MRTATCLICGKSFSTKSTNVKYCPDCKKVGAELQRKRWEERTNYKERQRVAAQVRRNNKVEQEQTERVQRNEATKKEIRESQEKNQRRLEKRARDGDLTALRALAMKNRDAREYWRLYKELCIAEDERMGRVGNNLVGGISVYEDNFEYLVLEQINSN